MRRMGIYCLIGVMMFSFFFISESTEVVSATTIIVPDHYPTIQDALDAANPGDIIYVRAGNYYENIYINNSVTLHGEDKDITIIDGSGSGDVVNINADKVNVTGFTIMKSGSLSGDAGIQINSNYNTIDGNIIIESHAGIYTYYSRGNTISTNTVSLNYTGFNYKYGIILYSSCNNIVMNNLVRNNCYGIDLYFYSNNNTITSNMIINNQIGIALIYRCNNNTITHNYIEENEIGISLNDYSDGNTIMANTISVSHYHVFIRASMGNTLFHNNFLNGSIEDGSGRYNDWYHPVLLEGNYWSDYNGVDDGSGTGKHAIAGDGIGDTLIPHPEKNFDFYPLMRPWAPSITSTIDIDPDTLNLKSKGKWITAYITLPEGYDVNDIDLSTIILEDSIPAEWGDIQDDTFMVKFDRSEVEDMLSTGTYNLKVTGELTDGTKFEGYSDDIRVINPGK